MNVRLHQIRLNLCRLQPQELDETAVEVPADSTADRHSGTTRGLLFLPHNSSFGVNAALGMKRLQDVQRFVLVLLAE